MTNSASAPAAIVGIACRFPGGANTVEAFWRLLVEGVDALGPFPAHRLGPSGAGERDSPALALDGGFLQDIDGFDHEFFGISPREAQRMDPQQRLALEVAWEALEDAGVAPRSLWHRNVGVFMGVTWNDYATRLHAAHAELDAHSATGSSYSIVANRVSHFFGLRGPSMSVDTASSSSLVTVHLACQSLASGECELALAGGVNLVSSPQSTAALARLGVLSPGGRCRSFAEGADGYARGEGAAVVLLKPLERALEDGDRIYGVIAGSAVNNDGGGAGLTTPSAAAQVRVIHEACRRAGISPDDIEYVEAHGSGSRVGDPIEAEALGKALGVARRAPLRIGSVKTNIGHLEAAAGVAGLIKLALALHKRELPPSLHAERPNPAIPFDALNLTVQRSREPWTGRWRVASVSSFGFGGTNCHAVLCAAPAPRLPPPAQVSAALPLLLSGRSEQALRQQAQSWGSWLAEHPAASLRGACATALRRTLFDHRAAIVVRDRQGAQEALAALATDDLHERLVRGEKRALGKVVFVFPGQGSQWPAMGRSLLQSEPVFARAVQACDEALRAHTGWSVAALLDDPAAPGLPPAERVDVVQPALFTMAVALAALWRHWGVEPDAVVGHSQGEIAAAYVAGALSLAEAARIVALRSRLLRAIEGSGAMAVVHAEPERVRAAFSASDEAVLSISVVNSKSSTVVGGEPGALASLLERLRTQDVFCRVVAVDYASHSPQVEPILAALRESLGHVGAARPEIPFYSTVFAESAQPPAFDAEYWCANLRRPVRFDLALARLAEDGHRVFIEISPHPVLQVPLEEADLDDGVVVGSLRRQAGERDELLRSLCALHVAGLPCRWEIVTETTGALEDLPKYPFQRQRHWLATAASVPAELPAAGAVAAPVAPPVVAAKALSVSDLLQIVRERAAQVLGLGSIAEIAPDRSLQDLGLDSTIAVELRNHLERQVGRRLPTGLLFDYPTPRLLAEHLAGKQAGRAAQSAKHGGAAEDPIAVVGLGLRFPGGISTPEALWSLLSRGEETTGDFPVNRGWPADLYDADPELPGKSTANQGSFVHDADEFDAGFFGISPREALYMDPQQRLLLETSWEALERAGIAPTGLSGTDTGVFAGVIYRDYESQVVGDLRGMNGYVETGSAASVGSGRIAYTLGLQGPAVTVDTACSSSLVALHLALQSLRSGECSLALAGGATVLSTPRMFVEFSRQRGLSADGRCKAFSESADGVGWSEGCGMLVLERLSDARRHGHPVLGLLEGSAVNQDGRSQGLTAPNGPSQQRVIEQALVSAGIRVSDVQVVEGHGTGTTLGDPIEAEAILATYGQNRDGTGPLYLGSIKSNIGHTQAAAGVAGVMKMLLSMQHGEIPRTLHADVPSTKVDWSQGSVKLAQEAVSWESRGPRRGGVSSFGISGTNAHVIVREAPAEAAGEPDAEAEELPLLLSGQSEQGLCAQAERWSEWLRAHEDGLDTACRTAARRPQLEHRAAIDARDHAAVIQALQAIAAGVPDGAVQRDRAQHRDKIVFVYPGQGSQWPGMGRALIEGVPVFAAAVAQCDAALARYTDWSVRDVLMGEASADALSRVDVVQPAIFTMAVALTALWQHWGIEPDAVVGHSQGEIAAAYVAGALSLEDACRVVAVRGRVLREISGLGGMAVVECSAVRVSAVLSALRDDTLAIAAVNGPNSTVVCGSAGAVDRVVERLGAENIFARRVAVDYAAHGPHVDPVLEKLAQELAPLSARAFQLPFYSSVVERELRGEELTAAYWCANLREPVRFDRALERLRADRHGVFVEVSSHPLLQFALNDAAGADGVVVAGLRRDHGGRRELMRSLARLHVSGVGVDWPRFARGPIATSLPTSAFQRQRFWPRRRVGASGEWSSGHPLLGVRTDVAEGGHVFTSRLSSSDVGWLSEHVVYGEAVFPGSGWLELALAAGRSVGAEELESLVLEEPLVLAGVVQVQVSVGGADASGFRVFSLHSRGEREEAWRRHGSGRLRGGVERVLEEASWSARGSAVDVAEHYARVKSLGLGYEGSFRSLRGLWRDGECLYAEASLEGSASEDAGEYGIHPALLDGLLQGLLALSEDVLLPFEWEGVSLGVLGARVLRAELRVHRVLAEQVEVSLVLSDASGHVVGRVDRLRARRASAEQVRRSRSAEAPLYALGYKALELGDVEAAEFHEVDGGAALPLLSEAPGVLCVQWGREDFDVEGAHAAAARGLSMLQRWLGHAGYQETTLAWVTHGALAVQDGDMVPDLMHAPLWGLGRTASNEHPERDLRLIDTDEESLPLLGAALGTGQPQVVLRKGQAWVPRLSRASESGLSLPRVGYHLACERKGNLDSLALRASELGPLAAGHVRLRMRAAGLNFRDVLGALGMYPGDAGPMGLEGVGLVCEVAPDVTQIRVGQRVMGLVRQGFAELADAEAVGLIAVPEQLSDEEAATVPVAYLTAHYGLFELGGLARGQRVLIHAAAGGVGMAALHLAQRAGAEVFATASTGKQGVLRGLGLPPSHIGSSRDLSFEAQFTSQGPFDVVLNALSGEYVDASLRLLKPGGVFVEMGKTDVREASQVFAEHGVRYRAFDLLTDGWAHVPGMLRQLGEQFSRGELGALPRHSFELRQAREAFRFMAQAKHVGKVVLRVPQRLDGTGTVLVTGGTGGLGRLTAEHLVREHGVKHLLLLSRQGASAAGVEEQRTSLLASGAQSVEVVACDVSDRAQLAGVLDKIPSERPLQGVFHTAGVLEDGVVQGLDAAQLHRVLRPKLDAASHLDALTRGSDVRAFVLFSSVAGVLGNPGQGNYAAANQFLDALAQRRRACGLPATSLAWGPWAEVGMAAKLRSEDVVRLRRQGLPLIQPSLGTQLLTQAMARAEATLVPALIHVQAFDPAARIAPVLRGLVQAPARTVDAQQVRAASASPLRAQLAQVPRDAQRAIVLRNVQSVASNVLSLPTAAHVEEQRALKELGIDSLMAVELRNRLAELIGERLPATFVFDYPTPAAITDHLLSYVAEKPATQAVTRRANRAGDDDVIAVVGMGLRFPGGVKTPEGLWSLLSRGEETTGPFPQNRGWPADLYSADAEAAGKSSANQGSFVYDADQFDAGFFRISPREALYMDPQQRLLLETSWEALERAGIAPTGLSGTNTGVFVGVIYRDYESQVVSDLRGMNGYVETGSAASVGSGRIAYTLGLQGPAVTVDTACSSSLVALHLALQSLRSGECSLALTGGATVLSTPRMFVEFSRQRGLSADGRCKAFSEAADGVGWSEGCGMLVLERLSDARRHGHPVLGLLEGSAVNQDGRSQGLTAPNGPSQQRVIAQALASAGISASDVQVVEGHGTGTMLGDPIEAQAILSTYGQSREGTDPLHLGSIKSNLGHMQAAAGVAGVMKMLLSMQHGEIPRTLHAEVPSTKVDWSQGSVKLVQEAVSWECRGPRRGGVSSFGISGTNAHVIVREAPAEVAGEPADAEAELSLPLLLSGQSEEALRAQAGQWSEWLRTHAAERAEGVRASVLAREHLSHRAAFLDADAEALEDFARGREARAAISGEVPSGAGLAILFPGQGSQVVSMGRGLYERLGSFRRDMEELSETLSRYLERPLLSVLFAASGSAWESLLNETQYAQPALFALGVSLYREWARWGVVGDVFMGHSVGEIAAAHVAGVLDLDAACRLVCERSRRMQEEAQPGGAMASVAASESEVASQLTGRTDVCIGAVNGPESVVLSGDASGVEEVCDYFRGQGRRVTRLRVSHAFHSSHMEPMLEGFSRSISGLRFGRALKPVVANVSGSVSEELSSADYWVRQVRSAVRFGASVEALAALGVSRVLECGPGSTLCGLSAQAWPGAVRAPVFVSSLRTGQQADEEAFREALARLHVSGQSVSWSRGSGRVSSAVLSSLPTYAFQRQRFWPKASRARGDASALGLRRSEHPLLGAQTTLAESDAFLLTGTLDAAVHPWLSEHVVFGEAVFPGSGWLELALAAGRSVGAEELESLVLEEPLVLTGVVQVQVSVSGADGSGFRSFSLHSRGENEEAWRRHGSGRLRGGVERVLEEATWSARGNAVDVAEHYARVRSLGLGYEGSFRSLRGLWRDGDCLYAEASLEGAASEDAGEYGIHPALLDGLLQGLLALSEDVLLPFEWEGVSLSALGARVLRAELRVHRVLPEQVEVSLLLSDASGHVVGRVDRLRARRTSAEQVRRSRSVEAPLYALGYKALELGDVAAFHELDGGAALPLLSEAPGMLCVRWGQEDFDVAGAHTATARGLSMLQRWLGHTGYQETTLAWVTHGALAVQDGDMVPDLMHSSFWGLGRTASNEHPERDLRLIDTDEESLPLLGAALGTGQPQVVLRKGQAWVPRLSRASESGLSLPRVGYHLACERKGNLDSLALRASELGPIAAGHVRLRMRAAGLNFREVLGALGMYPGDAGPMGLEGVGLVCEVAPDVTHVRVGQRVMGLVRQGFAELADAEAAGLIAVPAHLSDEEAATVPVAYLTAHYGLFELGGLARGQRVLIHAAAGGVGMAALHLAQRAGAEVFATASAGKQGVLRGLGLPSSHIGSSRDLTFEAQFASQGPFDVVLNALSGEYVDASLRLLKPGGVFVEMGKTDIREASQVFAEHGVRYRAFDLLTDGWAHVPGMLRQLGAQFSRGELGALPRHSFELRQAREAFRFMAQAKHVGKVVLRVPQRLDGTGTVLVTGGTGGLGRLTAEHLVREHGVKHLLLLSRQGASAAGVEEQRTSLLASGAQSVEVVACDVSDRTQLAAVLGEIPSERPLQGVFHTAGVLEDGVVQGLEAAQLHRVLRPKLDAASHLDALTRGSDVRAFVLFSSVAGVLGNPGQGNYAAANQFLDALAQRRRACGLPATSLAWGPWAEVGMAAELSEKDRARLQGQGLGLMRAELALRSLDVAMRRQESCLVPVELNAATLGRYASAYPLLRALVPLAGSVTTQQQRAAEPELRASLEHLSIADRRARLALLVEREVSAVLNLPDGHLSQVAALRDHGLDSLTAVELRNRLATRSGCLLHATLLFDFPTVEALVEHLLAKLYPDVGPVQERDLLKDVFSRLSVAQLREAGLLGPLVALAGVEFADVGAAAAPAEDFIAAAAELTDHDMDAALDKILGGMADAPS